ncbi:C-C motif chemokine 16 [Castor canadensis]|uniref:C-C motif chemokine 16 n=1 Tax=Castor canadensis TaxID=51338 RepID=A0AC58KBV7_CASCN
MKVSVATLFLLLVLTTTSASYSQQRMPESVNPAPNCCPKYHEKVLPKKFVAGYKKALNCYLPAIVFVTKKNREVCTNPNDEWVQEYIKDPNIPLLPSGDLAQVKIIKTKKSKPQLFNSSRRSGLSRSPSLGKKEVNL